MKKTLLIILLVTSSLAASAQLKVTSDGKVKIASNSNATNANKVSDRCVDNLFLTHFPYDNSSNLILYEAGNKITVSENFVIPQGVHVIFDAPEVVFEDTFSCPIGASFETRSEGCEL